MSRASALRQLPVKDEVPLDNISREQLRTYLLNDFEKENAAEDIEKDRTLLVLLGLLKESDDLREIWLGLLGEQILGFYEFETHKMTLVEAEQELSPKDELSLAHEYVHALQDQNFDLGDRIEKAKGPGERVMGLKALSEGDATLAMGAYARLHMTAEQLAELEQSPDDAASQEKLRAAPLILQLSLLFPYQQGAVFTSTLYLSGGWPAVDRAYSDPPVTTEQVMHPQKYLEREGPKPVDTPDLAKAMGPGWSLWDDDTMGELDWLGYLATFVPADRALRAAAGWGGDRMVLLKSDAGKPALVSASVWDTALDAQEFYSALHDIMQSKPGVQTVSPRVDSLAWTEPSHSGYAGLKGDRVLLIISPDEATTKRLVDAFGGS